MIHEISARHKQIARLLVGGHSQSDIARLLSLHKSTVSRVVRDSKVAQEVARLQQIADVNIAACVPGVSDTIQEGAVKGIEELLKILQDERTSPEILKLKAQVALELLGRAGYGEVKQLKVQQSSVSAHFTSEDIENIKRRAGTFTSSSHTVVQSETNAVTNV